MIVVGPNPATDRLQVIGQLDPGGVHRATRVEQRAGGKSFIVTRSIRRRGVDVAMHGFIGGSSQKLAETEQDELGITNRHTSIAEDTRLTTVLVEQSNGRSTVINEPGPVIAATELEQFKEFLSADVQQGDLVVCTGSLPQGVGTDFYAKVVAFARSRNALTLVDASGEALKASLTEAPWAVKCNLHEFAAVLGLGAACREQDVIVAMQQQCRRGSSVVIITMGGEAFLVVTEQAAWKVTVPQVEVVNATGSGDTFLGCFVAAAAKGESFCDALRDAAAGGSINAAQLDPGLQTDTDLEPHRSQVEFSKI
ncbi:MAG: 1-phosphofructokinase family hexose kinase [Galactobacter sp.]